MAKKDRKSTSKIVTKAQNKKAKECMKLMKKGGFSSKDAEATCFVQHLNPDYMKVIRSKHDSLKSKNKEKSG